MIVYFGLGSNIGNRKENLHNAISMLLEKVGKIIKTSAIYESEAWGYKSDNRFLNMVAAVETMLLPEELLVEIKNIERLFGRPQKTSDGYEDRPIDIDILFYDNQILETAELSIPHPRIVRRKFVLAPMVEIAPDFVHPFLCKNIKELNELCVDPIQLFEDH